MDQRTAANGRAGRRGDSADQPIAAVRGRAEYRVGALPSARNAAATSAAVASGMSQPMIATRPCGKRAAGAMHARAEVAAALADARHAHGQAELVPRGPGVMPARCGSADRRPGAQQPGQRGDDGKRSAARVADLARQAPLHAPRRGARANTTTVSFIA